MDAKDVDMMDSDAPVTSSSPVPPGTPELSSVSQQIEIARGLLTVARQLIDQGKPSQALQAVILTLSPLHLFLIIYCYFISLFI